jgi:hypothetical protein
LAEIPTERKYKAKQRNRGKGNYIMAGYKINGKPLSEICEIGYAGSGVTDRRAKASINNLKFLTNGLKRSESHPNEQYITYPSEYIYASNTCSGKLYSTTGSVKTEIALCEKGCRPSLKHRYSSSSNFYLNVFDDGEIWASATENSRTGTKLSTAEEKRKFFFITMVGGGGGGGGSNSIKSGGGGGGGAYIHALMGRLDHNYKYYFTVGNGGTGGGGNSDGEGGGSTKSETYTSKSSTTAVCTLTAGGGGRGKAGKNDGSGGGGGSVSGGTTDNAYYRVIKTVSGGNGGSRNNSGSHCTVNFKNYTPEEEQITYLTGVGGGAGSGSTGGGGGGGASPMANGGKGGGSYEDGHIGEGAGAGGGGGIYVILSSRSGAAGTSGAVYIYY